jgi:hypothetical protein
MASDSDLGGVSLPMMELSTALHHYFGFPAFRPG